MEDEIVLPETQTPDEELELDLDQPTEDVEKLKETNKRLYERAKKAENDLKAFKGKPQPTLPTPKPDVLDSIQKDLSELKQEKLKRQFGYENSLSPEEVDRVFQISPNPTKELLDDDFVKAGLRAIRAKKRVEANTPGSSSSSRRSAPVKPLSEMTADEKQAAFEERQKERFGK